MATVTTKSPGLGRVRWSDLPYVNVKSYGAVGDGVVDDTIAIQAAITAASTSVSGYYSEVTGRTVLFPAGTYKLTSAITIAANAGVLLLGEGKTKSTVWQATADTNAFNVSGANFRGGFRHLRIAGVTGQVGGASCAISVATSGNQIDVKECWINNFGYAISGNPTSDSNFTDNVVEYCLTPVALLGAGNGYFAIAHNVFYNCGPISLGASEQRASFDFNATVNLVFAHNRITCDQAMSPQTNGLFLFTSTNDLVIDGNIFTGTTYDARTFVFSSCSRTKIINNVLKASARSQIRAVSCTDICVSGNTVPSHKSPGTNADHLVKFDACVSVKVSNNTFGKPTLYTVYAVNTAGTSSDFDISNNTFDGGTATAGYPCVQVQGTSGATVVGNRFRNGSTNTLDLFCDSTTGFVCQGNHFTKGYSIDAATVSPTAIRGNIGGATRTYLTAAPVAGTWIAGDEVIFEAPSASGFRGAVCVTGGTPGTWKTFGAISA